MPMLQVRGVYVDPILDGRKRQTLRAELGGGFSVGNELKIRNGYRANALVGTATISAVDKVLVSALTDEDARLDGFDSLEALRAALAKTYPHARAMYRIRWRDFVPSPTFTRGR